MTDMTVLGTVAQAGRVVLLAVGLAVITWVAFRYWQRRQPPKAPVSTPLDEQTPARTPLSQMIAAAKTIEQAANNQREVSTRSELDRGAITCWNCHRVVASGVTDCPSCVAPLDPDIFLDLPAMSDDPPEMENPPVFAPLGEYRDPSRCPACGAAGGVFTGGCVVCTDM